VYIASHLEQLPHHKLSTRGEACIHLGLGFASGCKGWVCWIPFNNHVEVTHSVAFDETFMPASETEQRILAHYNTTPRRTMLTEIHGSMEACCWRSCKGD
jgi:hypothetical protein